MHGVRCVLGCPCTAGRDGDSCNSSLQRGAFWCRRDTTVFEMADKLVRVGERPGTVDG